MCFRPVKDLVQKSTLEFNFWEKEVLDKVDVVS